MPEGPEIRKAADKVEKAIINKPILKVTFGQAHLKHKEIEFIDVSIDRIDTYGKPMVTRFNSASHPEGLNIYTHNQLYGRWVCCPANQVPQSNRQLRLAVYTSDQWALLYSASDILVLNDQEILDHPFIKKIGKDVLNFSTTVDFIKERLLSPAYKNRQLGNFLTEQSFIAGLGNYLRCDVLFVAKIHPSKKASELSNKQLNVLSQTILKLPRQSYNTDSVTNDLDRVEKLLAQGSSLEDARFWTFRRDDLPCYDCGATIIKKKMGGQACYLCEVCQKL
ncbi:MAG: endonuclease VIII [Thiotrichaceae bacterium]|nr:endonuclease VIII [Thiotrichaceae bacterium]